MRIWVKKNSRIIWKIGFLGTYDRLTCFFHYSGHMNWIGNVLRMCAVAGEIAAATSPCSFGGMSPGTLLLGFLVSRVLFTTISNVHVGIHLSYVECLIFRHFFQP